MAATHLFAYNISVALVRKEAPRAGETGKQLRAWAACVGI